jgi:hypothetical protein
MPMSTAAKESRECGGGTAQPVHKPLIFHAFVRIGVGTAAYRNSYEIPLR